MKSGVSLDDPGSRGRGQTKFAQKVLASQKQPPAPTLFFGNLGFETTVDSIRGLLEAHRVKEKKDAATSSERANDDESNDPWIRKIRMGTFEDSGLCKGSVIILASSYLLKIHADSQGPSGSHLSTSRAQSTQPPP